MLAALQSVHHLIMLVAVLMPRPRWKVTEKKKKKKQQSTHEKASRVTLNQRRCQVCQRKIAHHLHQGSFRFLTTNPTEMFPLWSSISYILTTRRKCETDYVALFITFWMHQGMCEGQSPIKHLVNTDCNYEQLSQQYEVKSVRSKVKRFHLKDTCEGPPKYLAIHPEDLGKFTKLRHQQRVAASVTCRHLSDDSQ